MKNQEEIQKAIDGIKDTLNNIVEGSIMEALYTGQLAALEWVLKEEELTND